MLRTQHSSCLSFIFLLSVTHLKQSGFFLGGGHTQTHTQRQTQRFVLQPVQRAIMWLTGK